MRHPVRRIVAIGGGGFSTEDWRGLQERWLVSLTRARSDGSPARVLFVGTASGDAERYQLRFYRAFAALGCVCETLAFFPYDMRRDYAAAVRSADLVFVGGGNTPAMLDVWRSFGFDTALRAAYEAGTVLAGISAGANCWFEQYVTDSVPGGGVRPSLGWLPGTFCPHLDSEPWREPMLRALTGPWVGAGEHVAMRWDNEALCASVHSHPGGPPLALARAAGDAAPQTLNLEALR